jgi:hypothetical protein
MGMFDSQHNFKIGLKIVVKLGGAECDEQHPFGD